MAKKSGESSGGLRALVFLILALVAGAAATILVHQLIKNYQDRIAEAKKPDPTVMVIIAAGDLYPGLPITEQDIVGINMPVKYKPTSALTAPELVVGRIPRERILANEFILPDRLADSETGVGLNALVPSGMRAISIGISNGAALSGFLDPGNIVDVLVTMTGEDAGDKPETLTLLQAVNVLAVNGRLLHDDANADPNDKNGKKKRKPRRESSPSVTLAVTPEQAEQLAHAERIGSLTLTLRPPTDTEVVDPSHVATEDLLGEEEEPAKAEVKRTIRRKEPEGQFLQITRGGTTTSVRTDAQSGAIKH